MIKFYRKPYRIKRKKSILRNRFFWFVILFFVAAGIISYFLFFSGIFQIKTITIIGEEKVSKEDIKLFIPSQNIFFLNIQAIRAKIFNNFSQIAELEINRSLPDTLNVVVRERIGVAIWCNDMDCFVIDRKGIAFERALPELNLIKIFGDSKLLNEAMIPPILKIKAKSEEALGIDLPEATIISEERVDIKTSENWQIYFNLKGDLDWQMSELNLVLEKQIPQDKRKLLEYIDLRFSRVYYKYRY